MKNLSILAAAAIAALLGTTAQAQVISVQYGANTVNGSSAGLVPETIWNSDTTTTTFYPTNPTYNTGLSNLVDSTGTPTGISERTANDGMGGGSPSPGSFYNNPNTGFSGGNAALYTNGELGAYQNGHTFLLSLSGLDPAATYDLILYTTAFQGDGSTTHLTALFNNTSYFTPTSTSQGSFVTVAPYDGSYGLANYLEWGGISGAAINSQAISISSSAGQGFIFNGFQLVLDAAPEPSTWAMMLAGLGLLSFCVRRQRA